MREHTHAHAHAHAHAHTHTHAQTDAANPDAPIGQQELSSALANLGLAAMLDGPTSNVTQHKRANRCALFLRCVCVFEVCMSCV
jgi:hypothetical protein